MRSEQRVGACCRALSGLQPYDEYTAFSITALDCKLATRRKCGEDTVRYNIDRRYSGPLDGHILIPRLGVFRCLGIYHLATMVGLSSCGVAFAP